MGKKQKQKQQKIILPPQLPPEVRDDEIEVSDEDLNYFHKNRDYATFVSHLDTTSINKHVTRVANLKEEDALESLYEKRLQKRKKLEEEENKKRVEVDRVDALPVKTLDGQLYYRTLSEKKSDGDGDDEEEDGGGVGEGIVRLTKAERRAKLKKSKKEAKKLGKEVGEVKEGVEETKQATVLVIFCFDWNFDNALLA